MQSFFSFQRIIVLLFYDVIFVFTALLLIILAIGIIIIVVIAAIIFAFAYFWHLKQAWNKLKTIFGRSGTVTLMNDDVIL